MIAGVSTWLLLYVAGNLGYRLMTHLLMLGYVTRSKKTRSSLSNYPGISILIPIKGVRTDTIDVLDATLGSLFRQEYPGELEIVIAIRDEDDPAVEQSKALAQRIPTRARVKWAIGGVAGGLNPKNSNLFQAFQQADHAWIYCSDADTRLEAGHLKSMIEASEGNPSRYVTSITIHEGPRDLGACLESLGTNLEATGFFLFAFLNPRCGVLNGASNLFHRSLLEKIGGFERTLNALTDDLFMGKLFVKAGAEGRLAPRFVRVTQDRQSMQGFRERHIRWMMIAKYFRPDLFWPAPLNWAAQWILLYAVVSGSSPHLAIGVFLLFLRMVDLLIYESLAGAPREDWGKVWAILIYDLLAPPLWASAIFRKRVVWGGNVLWVRSDGMVGREETS